ncbi:MAG: hypothetical protein LC722_08020, partial [Actinobacteria bacterium]|nr:hypothetical protein [Actinomycetota bacterium]
SYLDLDERVNRLSVGVQDEASEDQVIEAVRAHQVPLDAVRVMLSGPVGFAPEGAKPSWTFWALTGLAVGVLALVVWRTGRSLDKRHLRAKT